MLNYKPFVIALDLEGTLISNAVSQFPRPGLGQFLEYCHVNFPRIVIFTAVRELHFRNLAEDLVLLKRYAYQLLGDERSIRYFAQDESRFGLKPLVGQLITALRGETDGAMAVAVQGILVIWGGLTFKWRAFYLSVLPGRY